MSISTIGSTFEISLRILLMLNELQGSSLMSNKLEPLILFLSMQLILVCWMKIFTDTAITDSANTQPEST